MKLANNHIFVTGGSKGIGKAIVRDCAEAGAKVSFVDIDVPAGEAFAKEMRDAGFPVAFAEADVTDFQALERAYKSLVAQFGEVTGVVNNAGVNSYADPVTMTDEEWDAFFAVDMKAIWLTAKLALPAMRIAKKGAIVIIGSIHGRLTFPNFFPYGAAKSAILGLMKSLGVDEGKHNIRTNTVAPGYVLTPLTQGWLDAEVGRTERSLSIQPMGRMGEPHEIAKVVSFLLSDDASFVNASDWAVDGGLSARSA
jgi:NAD(P)-dependent dehydrogenase (short-subunit alcohol dehydrogenase family)